MKDAARQHYFKSMTGSLGVNRPLRTFYCVSDAVRPRVADPSVQVHQRGGCGERTYLHAVRRA